MPNWSYEALEQEVRVNVVYRSFCRIGMGKVPNEKILVRLRQAIGPEAIRQLHDAWRERSRPIPYSALQFVALIFRGCGHTEYYGRFHYFCRVASEGKCRLS